MPIIDFILHIDEHLSRIIELYGSLTYLILFIIIFAETGFVITPFLPGDSLLFIAGAFAAKGSLSISWLLILLIFAAILGDTVNYFTGHYLGEKAYKSRFLKKEHLEKTEYFFKKYGKKTIIIARFVPIVRTLAPFVAGVGRMQYATFVTFNICGGILWVTLFLLTGYFFGNVPAVEENFTLVIFLIIFLSILPPVYEYAKNTRKGK